jgi:hypothetical protein
MACGWFDCLTMSNTPLQLLDPAVARWHCIYFLLQLSFQAFDLLLYCIKPSGCFVEISLRIFKIQTPLLLLRICYSQAIQICFQRPVLFRFFGCAITACASLLCHDH